jgi:hypothetical protein
MSGSRLTTMIQNHAVARRDAELAAAPGVAALEGAGAFGSELAINVRRSPKTILQGGRL